MLFLIYYIKWPKVVFHCLGLCTYRNQWEFITHYINIIHK